MGLLTYFASWYELHFLAFYFLHSVLRRALAFTLTLHYVVSLNKTKMVFYNCYVKHYPPLTKL